MTFRFPARPSGGQLGLAGSFDGSAGLNATAHVAAGTYDGYVARKLMTQASYLQRNNAKLGFLEPMFKF